MSRSQRTRSVRALANDAAILRAAVEEVLSVGVDHLSLRDVGHRAGLTHGATYARYEDVDELLVDVWISLLRERVTTIFERCQLAAIHPSAVSVGALLDVVRASDPVDVAALRVLLTARRVPTLSEEVEPFITEHLDRRRANVDRIATDAHHARTVVLFAMMTVQILAQSNVGANEGLRVILERALLAALETDPHDVEPAKSYEPKVPFTLPSAEDLRTQLSLATFGVVGKSGYTRATISRIARRAHCSPGAIYKLYPSKEDLVIAAFDDLVRTRWLQVSSFVNIFHEQSLSELLSDVADPKNAVRTNFVLEAYLAGAHLPRLRSTVVRQITEITGAVERVESIGDNERARLRHVVLAIVHVTVGVTFVSTVTPSLSTVDFNQFAEPFRRALLADGVPAWDELRLRLREGVARSGV